MLGRSRTVRLVGLLILVVTFLGCASRQPASERPADAVPEAKDSLGDLYLPPGILSSGDDRRARDMLGEYLAAHREPTLFTIRDAGTETYRVLVIPSLLDSCAVRVERLDDGWRLTSTVVATTVRNATQAPGTFLSSETRVLGATEAERFRAAIEASRFWYLRSWSDCVRPFPDRDRSLLAVIGECVDGTSVLVEGRVRDDLGLRYHAIDRGLTEPDGSRELVETFLDLAGIDGVCRRVPKP